MIRALLGATALTATAALTVPHAGAVITNEGSSCKWQVFTPRIFGNTRFTAAQALAAIASNDVWVVAKHSARRNTAYLFFHFDGRRWSKVQTPYLPKSARIFQMSAVSSNDVWGAGDYRTSSHQIPLVINWNGSSWQIVPTPAQSGGLYSIRAIGTGYVGAAGYLASGQTLIEHFNGSVWALDKVPSFGIVDAIGGASTASLWAGGISPGFLHWDQSSSSWGAVDQNGPSVGSISARSDSDVWALTESPPIIQRYDGTQWSTLSFSGAADFFTVDATSRRYTWVTGTDSSGSTSVWRYDGTQWTNMNLAQVGAGMVAPYVAAIPGSSDAWVAGEYTASAATRAFAERWTCR